MVINGKDYGNKDLDFTNVLCDLEDIDIDIMSITGDKIKPFTLCRGIVSVYTGIKDLNECGKILSEHLRNGGTMEDILDPFTEAMEASGFGSKAEAATLPQGKKSAKAIEAKEETQTE